MALPSAQLNNISTVPGVQPDTDQTNYNTNLWTFSDQVRFVNGNPQKDGGYVALTFDNMAQISGVIRSIWSGTVNQQVYTLIGTNSRLYALIGSGVYNITPFVATSTAVANSLSTEYGTLTNPFSTTAGSSTVTVTDADASRFIVGDSLTLANATATGGLTAAQLNGTKIIKSVAASSYTFTAPANATSTATGGGTVIRSSGLIRVTTPNTLSSGDRVKISYAADLMASSAAVSTAGSGYAIGDTLTPVGGTPENNSSGTPQTALFTVSANSAVSAIISAPGTGSYTPASVLTAVGGTGTAATFTIVTTQVVSATVNTAGTGGTAGTQIVTGTTGTGTKFQASVTVASGGITAVNSITVAGSYTVNPTLTGEPVTGGGLTGAKLNLSTGALTVTAATGGSYTSDAVNPVSTTGGGGTGTTLTVVYGVSAVSLTTAGLYSASPANPASTTTSGSGTNAALNITYTGFTNVGGITNSQINMEFIARNMTGSYFDVMTGGTSTSAVTASGGSSTVYFTPLPAGQVDVALGQGYGAGRYGVGLYGTALQSQTGKRYPQIWFFDRYGQQMLMTPGNGGGLYQWAGSTTTAPTLVPNAPTAINYFFVSDNIIVTFGNGGTENRITASDVNGPYIWTGTAQNQVFDGLIQGANRLLGHAYVQGLNLIFTENQVYTFQYVGLPNVWKIQLLSNSAGIIGPLASVSVNGIAYWQGPQNWYQWSGGNVEVMPSNVLPRSTILSYVYSSLNFSQQYKSYAWHNPSFNEIRFHYPSNASVDCNMAAVTNLLDMTWWPTTVNRTAAESPQISLSYPRLSDLSGVIYQHENGVDANGSPLTWIVSSNLMTGSKNESLLSAFIPDSFQTGNINVQVVAQQWPQSVTPTTTKNYTITPTSGRQEMTQKPRFWLYTLSGSALGQVWNMGKWAQEYSQIGDGK